MESHADNNSLVGTRSIVIESVATAITEASGWHATLHDKNVTLV
jgi:hypothetical protein